MQKRSLTEAELNSAMKKGQKKDLNSPVTLELKKWLVFSRNSTLDRAGKRGIKKTVQ